MVMVRLASRAVIGASDRADDLAKILTDLSKIGVNAVNVSLLGKADTFGSTAAANRGKGPLGAIGKVAGWLSDPRQVDVTGFGPMLGAGALAEVLAGSPNTSPVGALVMQGVPQRDALIVAELLTSGKILILVGVVDRTMGERVRSILTRNGASSIAYYSGRPYGTAFHGTGPGLR
jgi:hypothetical protein